MEKSKYTTGGMNSKCFDKRYLQLYNLTFNDKLNVNDGSVLFMNEVNLNVKFRIMMITVK